MKDVITELYKYEAKLCSDIDSPCTNAHYALVDMGVVGARSEKQTIQDENELINTAMILYAQLKNEKILLGQDYVTSQLPEEEQQEYLLVVSEKLRHIIYRSFRSKRRYDREKITVTTGFTPEEALRHLNNRAAQGQQFFVWYAWNEDGNRLGTFSAVNAKRALNCALQGRPKE